MRGACWQAFTAAEAWYTVISRQLLGQGEGGEFWGLDRVRGSMDECPFLENPPFGFQVVKENRRLTPTLTHHRPGLLKLKGGHGLFR